MTDAISADNMTTLGDPIYRGEGKWFKFTITMDGELVDLSTATFSFSVKKTLADVEFVYQADAGAFDDDQASVGIIRVNIPASVTIAMDTGSYFGELQTSLVSDTDVDKKLVKFKIKKAVTA